MMNRMLGFDAVAACPYAIALPAIYMTISVPKANLCKFPLESIRSLLCVVVAQATYIALRKLVLDSRLFISDGGCRELSKVTGEHRMEAHKYAQLLNEVTASCCHKPEPVRIDSFQPSPLAVEIAHQHPDSPVPALKNMPEVKKNRVF